MRKKPSGRGKASGSGKKKRPAKSAQAAAGATPKRIAKPAGGAGVYSAGLKRRMKEESLSLGQLAERLEMNRGTTSRYVRGVRSPSADLIAEHAHQLGVRPYDMLNSGLDRRDRVVEKTRDMTDAELAQMEALADQILAKRPPRRARSWADREPREDE